jgi:hypothetical protein
MCDEDSTGIGEIVPNDRMIYRACKRSIDLSKDKTTVEPIAFQKDGQNHRDGLSLEAVAQPSFDPIESIT